MAEVPSPYFSDPNLGAGVGAIAKAFTPDSTAQLRGMQSVYTAYRARKLKDEAQGTQEFGTALGQLDVRSPDAPKSIVAAYTTALKYGLDPHKSAEALRAVVANAGGDETLVYRSLVGSGVVPNTGQSVTFADQTKYRKQLEDTKIKQSSIGAGATITAAQLNAQARRDAARITATETPRASGPGRMYDPARFPGPRADMGFVNDPTTPTVLNPDQSISRGDKITVTAPTAPKFGAPGHSLIVPDASAPGGFRIAVTTPRGAKGEGVTLPADATYHTPNPDDPQGPWIERASGRQKPTKAETTPTADPKRMQQAFNELADVLTHPDDRKARRIEDQPRVGLPLHPDLNARLTARAAQHFNNAGNRDTYKNYDNAALQAWREIVGDYKNLEPDQPADERGALNFWDKAPPPARYQVLGAGKAVGDASKKAPGATGPRSPTRSGAAAALPGARKPVPAPAPAQPPVAAAPRAAQPLPLGPDGKADARLLKPGVVYDTPRGRALWTGSEMQIVP